MLWRTRTVRILDASWTTNALLSHARRPLDVCRALALAFALAATCQPVSAAPTSPAHVTLVLLIDASGSMKQSDPECLRGDAAELLLSLLPEGTRVSVAHFGERTQATTSGVVALTPDTRPEIVSAVKECRASDRFTDIAGAMSFALKTLQAQSTADRSAYPPHVVLLTDGRHEPGPSAGGGVPLADTLRQLSTAGGRVHALGLGRDVDTGLLSELGGTTGGLLSYAETGRDLIASYLSVARFLTGRWLLLDKRVEADQITPANLPAWVSDARVIFIPGTASASLRVDGGEWAHHRPSHEVIKVEKRSTPITLRSSGPGRVIVDGSGDLAVRPEIPSRVPSAVFFDCGTRLVPQSGQLLGSPQFLAQTTVAVRFGGGSRSSTVLYDDGQHHDGEPSDGHWAGRCEIPLPGEVAWRIDVSLARLATPSASGKVAVTEVPIRVGMPIWPVAVLKAALSQCQRQVR